MQRAHDEIALIITKMHTTALAVSEVSALGTLTLPHPFTVTVRQETVLPDIHEIILVDIALMIVGTELAQAEMEPSTKTEPTVTPA